MLEGGRITVGEETLDLRGREREGGKVERGAP
jgi:hypothetical protein